MSNNTKIQWSDHTWNVSTGCTRVSAGCDNCYAVAMTKRLAKIGATKDKYEGLVNEGKNHFNGVVRLHPEVLKEPLKWRKPRKVFVNSMSDLFHPEVPFKFIDQVFAVMALTPQHTYQVLTKRPERMAEYLNSEYLSRRISGPVIYFKDKGLGVDCWDDFDYLNNVWLGTSVEDQKAAEERIPHLLQCPAAVRFLSCEPLLGPVDLNHEWGAYQDGNNSPLRKKWLSGIHWVIVGGESGHNARPVHPDWVRSLRDQCKASGTAFFFKQWGKYYPIVSFYADDDKTDEAMDNWDGPEEEYIDGSGRFLDLVIQPPLDAYVVSPVGKKKAGRLLDGVEHNEFPKI